MNLDVPGKKHENSAFGSSHLMLLPSALIKKINDVKKIWDALGKALRFKSISGENKDFFNHFLLWCEANKVQLAGLNTLSLRGAGLHSVPGLEYLTGLEHLDLGDNHLTYFPSEIFNFHKLKILSLENNALTTISSGISKLNDLAILNIADNHLETLPHEIVELHNLTLLNAAKNLLQCIPSLSGMKNLEHLYLEYNQLSQIPYYDGLPSLKILCLQNNRFKAPDSPPLPSSHKVRIYY